MRYTQLVKNSLLSAALCILSFLAVAQQTTGIQYPLNSDEIFVLKVDIQQYLLQAKDPCLDAKSKSTLFSMEVKQVLYCPPNPVYDSTALSNVKYMIADPGLLNDIKTGQQYLLTAHFSSSKDYLVVSKILHSQLDKGTAFYHERGFFSNLISCNQSGRNPFVQFISGTTSTHR